jgi:hypothetical protein
MQISAPGFEARPSTANRPAQHDAKWRIARWPWLFVALIAVVNAATVPPLLSGNVGLLFAIGLAIAALAALPVVTARMRARKRATIGGWVVIALFLAAQIGGRFDFTRTRDPSGLDFSAYYLAGTALREDAKPLYCIPKFPDGRLKPLAFVEPQSACYLLALREGISKARPFIYPPFAAILFEPFSLLSFRLALIIWTGISVLLLFGAIYLVIVISAVENRWAMFIGAAICVFSLSAVRSTFYFGQINALSLFLWSMGVYFYNKSKPNVSAACFALGTMVKVTPLLVLPLFLLARKWRWVLVYAGCLALLLVTAAAGAGWRNLQLYQSEVLPSLSCGTPYFDNRSVSSVVQCWYLQWVPLWTEAPGVIPSFVCTASRVAAGLVYLFMLVLLHRGAREQNLTKALIFMTLVTLLVSPIAWTHHYVLAVLPLLYVWLQKADLGRALLGFTIFTTLLIGTNLSLYGLVIIRHTAPDLALAALQPITLILFVVACTFHATRKLSV